MLDTNLRSSTLPGGTPTTTEGFNFGRMNLGVDIDVANGMRSNNSTQPIQIHTFQGTPQANNNNPNDFDYDYATSLGVKKDITQAVATSNVQASMSQTHDALNVFSTMKLNEEQ